MNMLAGLSITRVAVAPSDSSTLFVLVQWGGALVSNDAGETWRLTHSESVNGLGIAVHPHVATKAYMGAAMNSDGFIATLSADGSILEYSTYFGGSSHEEVTDIALGGDGARYVAGTTSSTDLPVLNAVQPALGGLWDVFAARIAPTGSLGYSTYLWRLGLRIESQNRCRRRGTGTRGRRYMVDELSRRQCPPAAARRGLRTFSCRC